jgi:hypothetical protein
MWDGLQPVGQVLRAKVRPTSYALDGLQTRPTPGSLIDTHHPACHRKHHMKEGFASRIFDLLGIATRIVRTLILAFGFSALVLQASAAKTAAAPAPANKPVAPLILKVVSTEQPPGQKERFTHEIFLEATRYESLDTLKRHLLTLPRGTRIEYDSSCLGIFTRPLALYDDLVAFQAFCADHGVQLELTYATHNDRIKYLPK